MHRELELAVLTTDASLEIRYESDLEAHVEVTQLKKIFTVLKKPFSLGGKKQLILATSACNVIVARGEQTTTREEMFKKQV